MPRECLVYVKYKDGHSHISIYRLVNKELFGYNEMKRWIIEDDPEVVEVSISKVPPHLKKAMHKAIDAEENDSK